MLATPANDGSVSGAALATYSHDSRDSVRSDPATGLDWMATRAHDPSTGRFISRDPLGRTPLYLADNLYVHAGATPLSNVEQSG
jgi:RHS repeat-associated protein